MPSSKRKRKSGSGVGKRQREDTTTAESNVNPFLRDIDDSLDIDSGSNDDSMFQEVLNFMEFSKQLQRTKDQRYQEKLYRSVDILLSYLVAESSAKVEVAQGKIRPNRKSTTRHGMISINEIATLLLPWATKNLLRSASHENQSNEKVTSDQNTLSIEWKTLEACLRNDASNRHSTTVVDIRSIVTQSMLNKLVPLALQNSLQESGKTKFETMTTTAGNCFCLMVDVLYRPTFDLICDSLIPIIRTGIVNMVDFENGCQPATELKAIVSTLRLLRMMQGKANPKKAFLVLSKPDVLLALSDINRKIDSLAFSNNSDSIQSREYVRQVLFDGLFSHTHHLDGYRSIKMSIPMYDNSILPSSETLKNIPDASNDADDLQSARSKGHQDNKFRCYQENLFDTIDSKLSSDKPTADEESVLATINVIPLLLQGYFVETMTATNLKHWKKKGGKSKSSIHTEEHQFVFFARLASSLLEMVRAQARRSGNALQRAALVAIRACLELVLQHDVYIPSDEDKQSKKFSFLQTITRIVQEELFINHCGGPSEIAEGVLILDVLVRLNHLLLHDDLSRVVASCLTWQTESGANLCPEALDLFSTILRTYKKLRQLDHVFRSFLGGAETLVGKENCMMMLAALKRTIQSRQIEVELAIAVQTSPISQIQRIFDDIISWVQTGCTGSSGDDRKLENHHAISVVVAFFAVLVRHVRVERATSSTIDFLCRRTQVECVDLLVGKTSGSTDSPPSTLLKEGLKLCGWVIDLQTRCIFWIGNEEEGDLQADMPQHTMEMLSKAGVERPSGVNSTPSVLNELQFLACHRIKQLHSIIHEQERIELTSGSCGNKSSLHAAEARKLTAFAVSVASHNCESGYEFSDGWTRLAESLGSWTHYSEPSQVDSFLTWFFDVASTINMTQSYDSHLTFQPVGSEVVQSLLHDANFWEIEELTDRFGVVALSKVTTSCIQAIANIKGKKSSKQKEWNDFKALLRKPDFELVTPVQFSRAVQGHVYLNFPDVANFAKTEIILKKCMATFKILNGIPEGSWAKTSSVLNCLWSCLLFDHLCRSIAMSCESIRELALNLLGTSRTTSAKLLGNLDQKSLDRIAKKGISLGTLISIPVQPIAQIAGESADLDTFSDSMIISGGKKLAGAITRCCVNQAGFGECFTQRLDDMFTIGSTNKSISYRFVLICCARAVLQNLHVSQNVEDNRETTVRKKDVIKIFQNSMRNWIQKYAFIDKGGLAKASQQEAMMLVGDLVRRSHEFDLTGSWLSGTGNRDVENQAIQQVKKITDGNVDESDIRCISYFVACVASANPDCKQELIENLIATGAKLNKLLESAFCTIVRTLDGNELSSVLDKLQRRDTKSSSIISDSSRLRLFHLMVLNLETEEQIAASSRAARFFFSQSLQFLTSRDNGLDVTTSTNNMAIASSLIIDMAKNRDLIDIRERDVALILACVTSVMSCGDSVIISESANDHLHEIAGRTNLNQPVSEELYNSCFAVVSFLLQRFSKQLHACVPCLISTLNLLFQYPLYGTFVSELDIMKRGQKFSRLCELLIPYKEVYKKHVLSLLLEFVHVLKGGENGSGGGGININDASNMANANASNCSVVDAFSSSSGNGDSLLLRKASLTPAIYCLLDMLQQHELQQLNSMMDNTGKAVFRSVHQSYLKRHVYKGQ